MNKTLLVARWEFVERIKTKAFLIGLVLTPALMIGMSVLPTMLALKSDEESRKIAVFDATGLVFDSLHAKLNARYRLDSGQPNYALERLGNAHANFAAMKRRIDDRILDKSLEAAIIIPPDAFDSLELEYRGLNVSNVRDLDRFERIISSVISDHKLSKAGLNARDVQLMTKQASIRTVRVTSSGEKESNFLEQFGMSYFFIIMLMMLILQSGQLMVRSLVEEKSNRLVEVLVSSCSPRQLMTGKILGLSALGLTQLAFMTAIVVVMLVANSVTTLPLENLWLVLIYFFLGFVLYSGIFVAFGTLASTEQEAQQVTGYLTILLVIPIALALFATQSPNAPILRGLSMIPLLTPTLMVLRIPILMPPMWEIVTTLAILIASVAFVMWAAGKIFRVGILLTGKRPGLEEIVRWLRSK